MVSNHSGSIELRATFANDGLTLVPGQLVNVTVELGDIPHALVVPRDAVNDSPNGSFVFVVKGDKALDVPVSVLADDGTNDEVAGDGLAAGDMVVAEGQWRVTPGGAVRMLGKGSGQNFDGYFTIEFGIAGAIHFAHPIGTNRRKDFIRAEFVAYRERHVGDAAKFIRSASG